MFDFFRAKPKKKTIRVGRKKRGVLFFNPSSWQVFFFSLGTGLLVLGIFYLGFIYFPLTKAYLNYKIGPEDQFIPPPTKTKEIVDYTDFYIDIPKIKASSKVFPNIPVQNKDVYEEILKKGVAHARGTAFPGQGKTIFLFAHSSDTPFNAIRFNAVFMLLNQLKEEDTITIYLSGKRYFYKVYDKKTVDPQETKYLFYSEDREILILQTCWPPGTTWKRLLIFAQKEQD